MYDRKYMYINRNRDGWKLKIISLRHDVILAGVFDKPEGPAKLMSIITNICAETGIALSIENLAKLSPLIEEAIDEGCFKYEGPDELMTELPDSTYWEK